MLKPNKKLQRLEVQLTKLQSEYAAKAAKLIVPVFDLNDRVQRLAAFTLASHVDLATAFALTAEEHRRIQKRKNVRKGK